MKVLTLTGTRPELIRLSIIIKKLDILIDHLLVYTNQNYDYNLSGIFFEELGIRKPDYYFTNKGYSIGSFLANAILQFEEVLLKEKPDKMLVLGDTNSGLLALIANKHNIPIIHMESGNRCYDERLPEEINRRLIDHLSKYNLPYTENSKQNLLSEGFHKNYVFKTGNPIYEVLNYYWQHIKNSEILEKLELKKQNFVLVTAHRTENVDDKESLHSIVGAINLMSRQYPVVVSLHPRTKDKLKDTKLKFFNNVILSQPFGFFDFVKLEHNAKVVISDCLHPDTVIVFSDGTISNINSVNVGENVIGNNTVEKVLAKSTKKVSKKYKFITKYNSICCSENHRLLVQRGDVFIEKKAKNILTTDRLVSFCKINVHAKECIKLSSIKQIDYVKISDMGIEFLKLKSKGDALSKFGQFKTNTLRLKKGVSRSILYKVLDYLCIDIEIFNKYIYYSDTDYKNRQVLIKQPKKLNKEIAELVGFLCGDGYVLESGSRVQFFDKNKSNLLYLNYIIKKYFDIEGTIVKDERNECRILTVYSKSFLEFLKSNFGPECETTLTNKKDISNVICNADDNIVAGYIRGLFEAEGFVGDHHFAITMSDKKVIEKLKYLLLRFGIITNVYKLKPKRTRDKFILYQLNIYEHVSRYLFKEKIGFISKCKNSNMAKLFVKIENCSKHRPVKRCGNLFFDLIRKIEIIKDTKDYIDINVQPSNMFLADGILSHNSGTVQEECCLLKVPSITIRNSTERQETIECGSNILTGTDPVLIVNTFKSLLNRKTDWTPPSDYLKRNVSDTVINILLGR